jgi:hypothetical protein
METEFVGGKKVRAWARLFGGVRRAYDSSENSTMTNTERLDSLRDLLLPHDMGVELICHRYADDYWDEALRGAGCIYIVKHTDYDGVYSDSWSVYFMADGSVTIYAGMPAEAVACLKEWLGNV